MIDDGHGFLIPEELRNQLRRVSLKVALGRDSAPSEPRVETQEIGREGEEKQPESYYSDLLAEQIGGQREAQLMWGRADLMTADSVFEVESLESWRHGVRQVLAYAIQSNRKPVVAIYGKASSHLILRIYLRLRGSTPPIALCWFHPPVWRLINSRVDCRECRGV